VATSASPPELAEWIDELHGEYGYTSARLLNRDELQAHVRSPRYLGGLIDSRSGTCTRSVTQGLRTPRSWQGRHLRGHAALRYESRRGDAGGITVHTRTEPCTARI